jgi:hypothetical protein
MAWLIIGPILKGCNNCRPKRLRLPDLFAARIILVTFLESLQIVAPSARSAMLIEEWNAHVAVSKPKVTHTNPALPKPTKPRYYPRIPKLHVIVVLRCPRAGCITPVRASWSYPMDVRLLDRIAPKPGARHDLELRLTDAVEQLGSLRYCPDCGIPSVALPAQLAKWKSEVLGAISLDWLKNCREKLADRLSVDGRTPPKINRKLRLKLSRRNINFEGP